MSQSHCLPIVIFLYLFVFPQSMIECRPRTQRIIVHGHEWTVPNEPGWDDILREAEPIRYQLLSNCTSSRECRLAAEKLREIFMKQPISARYYDDSMDSSETVNEISSIFKWG